MLNVLTDTFPALGTLRKRISDQISSRVSCFHRYAAITFGDDLLTYLEAVARWNQIRVGFDTHITRNSAYASIETVLLHVEASLEFPWSTWREEVKSR